MGSVCWIGACQTERRNGKGGTLAVPSYLHVEKKEGEARMITIHIIIILISL